jgi:hypothetical protein
MTLGSVMPASGVLYPQGRHPDKQIALDSRLRGNDKPMVMPAEAGIQAFPDTPCDGFSSPQE